MLLQLKIQVNTAAKIGLLCYKEYLLTVDVRLLPGIGLTFDRFERKLICNAFCYYLGFDQLSDGFLLFRNDFHLAIRPKIGWNVSHSFKPWFPDVIYVFLAAGPLLVGVDGNILVSRGHSFESIRGRFALSFLPFPLSSSSASRDVLFHPPPLNSRFRTLGPSNRNFLLLLWRLRNRFIRQNVLFSI